MKPNNLYPYFDKYRSKETIELNHQEIEQAVDEVKGSDVDIKIQKIWDRFVK